MNQIKTLSLFLILLGINHYSQAQNHYPYQTEFEAAYAQHPSVPKGVLEAVAYSQTRFSDIHLNEEGCTGQPLVEGVMGLVSDGKGYFNNTKALIAQYSSFDESELGTPSNDIMAYAEAWENILYLQSPQLHLWSTYEIVLAAMSEIPQDGNPVNSYALSAHTFQILNFLRDEENQATYGIPTYDIDLEVIYGKENLEILRSKKVLVSDQSVQDAKTGKTFNPESKSFDYAPALWVATPTCNYSSRNGVAVSAVTIHTIQGSYAGAISWAQNCSANVSYHYVVRSSDGQITQMVLESDKGWHVGAENPYTIGIEHEGYVDNPAWYTTSLYNASAALVKDITQSGYGINPLRTFQGPATVGINVLGGCTKIKGHQHYPNNSHTDPGVNWDWEHFYQLINDNPIITSYTGASGTFYDSGGAGGDYGDDERELYLIEPPNVLSVTINFNLFDLEQDWDYMYVYDGSTTQDPLLGVYTGTSVPASLTSSGSTMLIEFRSDCATQAAGWDISWTTVPGPTPGDVIAPTTAVTVNGNWQTTDFQVDFTDADNVGGSGVDKQFYQVIHFDGTEWRANDNNGFFSDNFDAAIHSDWTQQTGTWGINASVLEQTDELSTNTNLWANLNQDNYDQWLYHFSMMIDGTGGNKRAGFHFMCDDPTLTNRGNSYFIWLRTDDNKIQIYKTVNDVFQLELDVPYTINDGQWYDIKTVYDKNTGLIQLYIDDVMEASWTDPTPYTNGNSISFRTGDAVTQYNNLKVYHDRNASELITIGTGNDAEFQNTDPLTPSAKIKSIVIDSSYNISTISDEFANIDWTAPSDIVTVNDGTGADINTTTTSTQISANWTTSVDPHSDLQRYWYAIGTSPNATDVVTWTDNWWSDTLTHSGLNLTEGITYYVCVYAENGAGLFSDTTCSDGQTVQVPSGAPTADFIVPNSYICSFEAVQVQNSSLDAQSYEWLAPGASPSNSTDPNPTFTYTATGNYDITLIATGVGGVDTTVQNIFVNIDTIPAAGYTASDYIVDISNSFVSFTNVSIHANGYTWDFDDGNISNDVNPWHQWTATGDYYVQLIAINGLCPNDTVTSLIQVVDNLEVSEDFKDGVRIYPNPVNDEFTVELSEYPDAEIQIQLFDQNSKLVLSRTFAPQDEFNVVLPPNVSEGAYYLRILGAEKPIIRKIIVQPR